MNATHNSIPSGKVPPGMSFWKTPVRGPRDVVLASISPNPTLRLRLSHLLRHSCTDGAHPLALRAAPNAFRKGRSPVRGIEAGLFFFKRFFSVPTRATPQAHHNKKQMKMVVFWSSQNWTNGLIFLPIWAFASNPPGGGSPPLSYVGGRTQFIKSKPQLPFFQRSWRSFYLF